MCIRDSNGMRSLEALLQAAGLDLMRVDIQQVSGISDDGLSFVGVGDQPEEFYFDEETETFVFLPGVGTHVWVASIADVTPVPTLAPSAIHGLLAPLLLTAIVAIRQARSPHRSESSAAPRA